VDEYDHRPGTRAAVADAMAVYFDVLEVDVLKVDALKVGA
jgi:hypothetical protein